MKQSGQMPARISEAISGENVGEPPREPSKKIPGGPK